MRRPGRPRDYPAVVSETRATFLIRPVRPDAYAALGELTVAAYRAIPFEMPHQDVYDVQLRDVARRAETSCVVVASTPAGELLGGVTYVSGPNDPYSEGLREGEAGMRMLAVDRAHRRRGVGRTLTEWCLARARADGRLRLILHTAVWMPDAIRLYERMGFARQPQIDFAPAPGIDLIAYSFDLAAGTPPPA